MEYDLQVDLANANRVRRWLRVLWWLVGMYLILCFFSLGLHWVFGFTEFAKMPATRGIAHAVNNNVWFAGALWSLTNTKADPNNLFWVISENRLPSVAVVILIGLMICSGRNDKIVARLEENRVAWENEQYRRSLDKLRDS